MHYRDFASFAIYLLKHILVTDCQRSVSKLSPPAKVIHKMFNIGQSDIEKPACMQVSKTVYPMYKYETNFQNVRIKDHK